MRSLELPDSIDLRTAPELGSLALLDAALIIAAETLRLEHADLGAVLQQADIRRPPDALIAALVAERCREMRALLRMYAAAVRRLHSADDLPF